MLSFGKLPYTGEGNLPPIRVTYKGDYNGKENWGRADWNPAGEVDGTSNGRE